MNVKAEGKNIQLLGDAMTNNGGSPPQTSTLPGNDQTSVKVELVCGECGSYTKLKEKRAAPDYERDHIPSKAALRDAAINRYKPKKLSDTQRSCVAKKVEARGITVAIPKFSHRNFSPTCGSRNTEAQLKKDAENPKSMEDAVDRDIAEMKAHLKDGPCEKAYDEAAKKIKAHDNEKMMDDALTECTAPGG
jgi:hypothetical protein